MLTLLSSSSFWLKPGTPVRFVLDASPDQILSGVVISIDPGSVGNGFPEPGGNGLLASPVSDPIAQRIPVNIRIDPLPESVALRYGGRVVVVFYPGGLAGGTVG
ncbi:hypothetical protein ACNJNU_05045 [Citrobacter freundii]|uniref:hypothetical protein n=1 Tax=Citrobacter freundii TaxID=546 RepID=UPI003A8487B1